MNRVSGPMAVLAGLVLMIPGLFALLHAASSSVIATPGWLVRDLIVCSLGGAVLTFWGAMHIRHRELELYELKPARARVRR